MELRRLQTRGVYMDKVDYVSLFGTLQKLDNVMLFWRIVFFAGLISFLLLLVLVVGLILHKLDFIDIFNFIPLPFIFVLVFILIFIASTCFTFNYFPEYKATKAESQSLMAKANIDTYKNFKYNMDYIDSKYVVLTEEYKIFGKEGLPTREEYINNIFNSFYGGTDSSEYNNSTEYERIKSGLRKRK